ncbi:hypothetical protein QN416_23410, partial [Glaciimonas sp. Cout2]|uniref:McrB family protein n=1 Tax=Glaciimonas sp. Cout2 TaxID=3048621 RepID=UPI002B3CC24B|nr:hypothetical protein [Glaciimonas sp. Cout2]
MAYDEFYEHYETKGFFFERSLLTTYCLALYTKPFVILSGISGTGKTKIAQLFNYPATQAMLKISSPVSSTPVDLPGKWILMTVTDGLIGEDGDGRANFKYKDLDALLNDSEVAALHPKIEQLRKSGSEDNICPPFSVTITGINGEKIEANAYLQRASSPLIRIRFKSKRGEPFYDSTTYFKQNHKLGDILKLEKIGEKHLRVVSVNDEVVIVKSEELAQQENKLVNNTCFISVRSDWTDSSALFGYYNLVEQKYHLTPFMAFILRAKENPSIPFFLLLDEMNLAKVEHYFSDFLSCVESRYFSDEKLIQEKIKLQAGSGLLETDDEYFDIIPAEIDIPQNLFVTGTVNIDESTYMFSPKVLDRANVIELNEVDLSNYDSVSAPKKPDDFVLEKFPPLTSFYLPKKQDYINLSVEAKDFLKGIHSILSKYQLHFGYRVVNEISRYIY